jgi:hypothetical protein
MIHNSLPETEPARRAWRLFAILYGEPIELSFVQELNDTGFWRFCYRIPGANLARTLHLRNEAIESITDEEVQEAEAVSEAAREAEARWAEKEQHLIALKLSGAKDVSKKYRSDLCYELRDGELAPRIRIRRRKTEKASGDSAGGVAGPQPVPKAIPAKADRPGVPDDPRWYGCLQRVFPKAPLGRRPSANSRSIVAASCCKQEAYIPRMRIVASMFAGS